MDEYSWAAAVGRIRVRQQALLNRSQMENLLDAQNLDTAFKILRDSEYGSYFSDLSNPEEFDAALEASLNDTYDFLMEISPEPLLIASYRAKHDFHNLKVLAKRRYLGMESSMQALSHTGNFTLEEIENFLDDEVDTKGLPLDRKNLWGETDSIRKIYKKLSDMDKGHGASFFMDAALDRSYYEWSTGILKRYGYKELLDTRNLEIDLLNLRMAARAKRQKVLDFSRIALLGGDLYHEDFLRAYDISFNEIALLYKNTPWHDLARKGVGLLDSEASLTGWERECDDRFMALIRKIKSAPLGPMAVVGYLLGKETEIRNLRIILAGLQSEILPGGIRERLREAYV